MQTQTTAKEQVTKDSNELKGQATEDLKKYKKQAIEDKGVNNLGTDIPNKANKVDNKTNEICGDSNKRD